jgi:hypothetical protein
METTYEKADEVTLKVVTTQTTTNEISYTKESLMQNKSMILDRISECKEELSKIDVLLARMEEKGIKSQAEVMEEKVKAFAE